jgi:phage/plasmid-associated DNA primase
MNDKDPQKVNRIKKFLENDEDNKKRSKDERIYDLAEEFGLYHQIKCTNKEQYHYNGKYWEEIGEKGLRAMVNAMTPPYMITQVGATVNVIEDMTHVRSGEEIFYGANRLWIEKDGSQFYLVNEQNGVLWIDAITGTVEQKKHDPQLMFTSILPVGFDPDARADQTVEIGRTILPDEADFELTLMFGAYCLVPHKKLQQALFWYGSGENGKGTWANIYYGVFGADLITPHQLEDICDTKNKVTLADLRMKILNVGTEINEKELGQSSMFKRLVTDQHVKGRDLYQKYQDQEYTWIKLCFMGNHQPMFTWGTYADFRRIRMILFPMKFDKNQKVDAEDIILSEGPGVLNLFLERMPKLVKMARLPQGGDGSKMLEFRMKSRLDPLQNFCDECVEISQTLDIGRVCNDDLRRAYQAWLRREELTLTLATDKMFRTLKDRYPFIKPTRLRQGMARPFGYKGMRLKKTAKQIEGEIEEGEQD